MLKHCQTAIILAGGKSSRLGFDKTHIEINNERLLDYQVKELKKLFKEIIIVSNQIKEYDGAKVVSDEYKEIGPLAGLHVGLKHASSFYSYVIACDMPFINLNFIKLIDFKLGMLNKEIIVAEKNGFIEPFNGFYQKALYKKIEEFIETHERFALIRFIKQTDYHVIDEQIMKRFDLNMFDNLNTPEDIKKYLKDDVIKYGKNKN